MRGEQHHHWRLSYQVTSAAPLFFPLLLSASHQYLVHSSLEFQNIIFWSHKDTFKTLNNACQTFKPIKLSRKSILFTQCMSNKGVISRVGWNLQWCVEVLGWSGQNCGQNRQASWSVGCLTGQKKHYWVITIATQLRFYSTWHRGGGRMTEEKNSWKQFGLEIPDGHGLGLQCELKSHYQLTL